MPKPKNPMGSIQITITTTAPVRAYLEELVKAGLYGKNAAEAAERLISRSIETLIQQGSIQRRRGGSRSVS